MKELTIIPQGNFNIRAEINGVILEKHHIESLEEANKIIEELIDTAKWVEAKQHYMVKDDKRGFWLTESSYHR